MKTTRFRIRFDNNCGIAGEPMYRKSYEGAKALAIKRAQEVSSWFDSTVSVCVDVRHEVAPWVCVARVKKARNTPVSISEDNPKLIYVM